MSQLRTRLATSDDFPLLDAALEENEDHVRLTQTKTWILEVDGEPTHFISIRPVFLVEPLKELPAAAKLSKNTRRRATLAISNEMAAWVADRHENRSGIYTIYAHVRDKVFQTLCRSWGMTTSIFPGHIWFRRDL